METKTQRVKVRKVNFKLGEDLVHHYFKNNIFSTHLANSLHIIFPEGEKFFIRSCRKYLSKIEDKKLKEEVIGFMGQEGTHSREHLKFWEYLEQQGFDVQRYANFLNKTAFEGIEPLVYKMAGDEAGGKFFLSITAGLEHYTALLAEVVFENLDEFEHCPEEMKHLFQWHAAEELEHKAVAYDLLNYVDDSYALRATGFITASVLLAFYSIGGQAYLISQDKELKITEVPSKFIDFMKSWGSPMVKKFFKNAGDYLKPDFHPNDMDNYYMAANYFKENKSYYAEF